MMVRILIMVVCLAPCLAPRLAQADDRLVRLYAPDTLLETGVLAYIVPRFSLKTQVRVEVTPDPLAADLSLGDDGRPLFEGIGHVWHVSVQNAGHPGTDKLLDWLTSEIGQRTITGYAPDGVALFAPPAAPKQAVAEVTLDGDADLGHKISRAKCTRCHAVDDATRGWGIGSTPSFGILRAFPDWEERFSAFYILNPHPAFTQIAGVTEPFPPDRPSPIAPVEMDLDELEAMMAYVAALPAADLGKPLEHQ